MTCQQFLTNMMSTPDHKLVNADPKKLAEKYVPDLKDGEAWVRMCLVHWRGRS